MTDDSQSDAQQSAAGVVMISGDLMFSSRVKAAAAQAGLEFRLGFGLPEQTESIRFVVLDLSTQSGQASQIAKQCAERCPAAKLIAYGPHVQVQKLEAARKAGIATVMTNGQFNSQLPTLFQ